METDVNYFLKPYNLAWWNYTRRYLIRKFRRLLFSCCTLFINWRPACYLTTFYYLEYQFSWYISDDILCQWSWDASFCWWFCSHKKKQTGFRRYKVKWALATFTRKGMGKIAWKLCQNGSWLTFICILTHAWYSCACSLSLRWKCN